MIASVYRKLVCAFICGLLCALGGCLSLYDEYFSGKPSRPEQVDPEILATYFDGPKVRPGVAVAISVTATGEVGQQAKQYFVDADGYISMELVGQIKCDGLSLIGLQEKIQAAYKEYYLDPHVSATFVYQAGSGMVSPWGTITVLGEVGRPGPVDMPPTQEMQLTRALQLAGGVSVIANKSAIKVTRCDKDGNQTKTVVDLVEIGEQGRPDKDMMLKSGDVVWVPMSWY